MTVAYLHSPVALTRERLLQRAAAAVAQNGTLAVIGHQRTPSWSSGAREHSPDLPMADGEIATRINGSIRLRRIW